MTEKLIRNQDKGQAEVVLRAMGRAINKTVSIGAQSFWSGRTVS